MATVVSGNTIKLNNGQTVQAQSGGWYDAQQFVNGSLSNPGQIHPESTQQGAGQQVSQEVVKQTNPNNVAYIQEQQKKAGILPAGSMAGGSYNPSAGGDGGAGVGFTPPATIDLPSMYQNLYKTAGISDLEAQAQKEQQGFNDAQSKINDNPFLSEADRTGRIQKLQMDYNNASKSTLDTIAMKKADVETQLNLQMKQFDINSQAAQQAMQQFNMLLDAGALNGASGEDIANITRSTGISSSMVQSAIKAKAQKDVQTSIMPYDDGTNQGFVVVNSQTGEVINRQTIAASKPKAAEAATKNDYIDLLKQDAQSGLTLSQIFSIYSGHLFPDEIYQLYNSSSKYGVDKGSVTNLAKYGVTQPEQPAL